MKPVTEGERIHDEVKRQVSTCTCTKQFRIHKIGEGKYRVSAHSSSYSLRYSV